MENYFNQDHFNFLSNVDRNAQGYVGNNSLQWAISVLPAHGFDARLDKRFNRYELFDFCKDPKNDEINVLTAILSWGGMRRDHGRLLLKNFDYLASLITDLRNGKYKSREEAFLEFQNRRVEGKLPGLGIGYYTKLICFLSPELNGYIMDQWVAKSINLLTGKNIVKLTSDSWVNDSNDSKTYESFCSHVDCLADQLKCPGFQAEEVIFSVGRGQGEWRNYLIRHYKNQDRKS
jgi:hypothetical protein